MPQPDLFALLRSRTHARVALGRAGDGLPTAALLEFQMAHAKARDAVHGRVDFDRLAAEFAAGFSAAFAAESGDGTAPRQSVIVKSAASDRSVYLRRPDFGRQLAPGEGDRLPVGPFDIVFVVADGLSSIAVETYAVAVVQAAAERLSDLTIGPVILASQARVAIGDEIAAIMGAALVVTMIGERPGLSTADSLGAYLTFNALPGTRDNARNCISNIHAHGLLPVVAADKIAWLAREAMRLKLTGVALKEAAPVSALPAVGGPVLLDG